MSSCAKPGTIMRKRARHLFSFLTTTGDSPCEINNPEQVAMNPRRSRPSVHKGDFAQGWPNLRNLAQPFDWKCVLEACT